MNESCMFCLHIFLLGSRESEQKNLAIKCTKRKGVKKYHKWPQRHQIILLASQLASEKKNHNNNRNI